jgi:predicted secreted protein
MNWFTALVVYLLIWWTALFAVLPIGTNPVAEPDSVTGWRGAPEQPRLWRKLWLTTLVTTVIWAVVMGLIESNWLSFRHGILKMPDNYTE